MGVDSAERRRRGQRAEARRAILDAAEAVLAREGVERLSMRRLAEECGYSAPTIYHYFGDKNGLLDAVLEDRFARLLTRVRRVRSDADPIESMRDYVDVFLRFAMQNLTYYYLQASRPEGSGPPSAEAARALMLRPLTRLAEDGRLRTDLESATQVVWAMVHGLISLQTSRPDYAWRPDLGREALDTVFRGLVRPDLRRRSAKPGGST